MNKLLHVIILILCIGGYAYPQQREACWLEGTVVQVDGQPLVNAHVAIYLTGGLPTSALRAVTDINGYFSLLAPYGDYSLGVSYQGQQQILHKDLKLRVDKVLLGKLQFAQARMLEAVEVVAQAPIVRYEGTKMIFGSEAFAQVRGGNVLEGIKMIPGLQVHQGSALKLYGLSDILVYVDGRALRMSVGQVASYLQGMSLDEIEAVELIREPGVEYGNTNTPILNIRRKTKGESGMKGFSQAGLVYQRYLSENFSTRVNLNHGVARSFVYYNLGDTRQFETTALLGSIDTVLTDAHVGHQIGVGTDISLGRGGTLGAQMQTNLSKERLYISALTGRKLEQRHLYGTLYHSIRRSSWGLETTLEAQKDNNNLYYQSLSATNREDHNQIYRLAMQYFRQLVSGLRARVGVESQQVGLRSLLEGDGQTFRLDEWNLGVYASLNYRIKQLSGEIGLRLNRDHRTAGRTAGLELDETYLRFLPFATMRLSLNANNALALTFNSTYIRPSFRDLMGFSSEASAHLLRSGNSRLQTSYRYSLAASYTYRKAAMLELSYVDTHKPIVEGISSLGKRYTIERLNLDYSRYIRALIALPVPLIHRGEVSWLASTYLAVQRQWDSGTVNGGKYDKAFNVFYIQHKHSLTLPSGWYAEVGATRYSPLVYGLYSMRAQWWMEFSLSRRIGDWRVGVTAYDLFNTNKAYGEYHLPNQVLTFERNWHSPKISLTISYNWGKTSLKTANRRSLEDGKRVANTANEGIKASAGL
ncbi:MAG: TonB-dependent receptor [Porphyromonas sp.]|nr:TonB-dependent receptor [Porphyromonas sp.]